MGVFLLLGSILPAKANIFASNIKFNGGTNSAILLPNQQVRISYILNEPATSGSVTLDIFRDGNLVRSIVAVWPSSGTLRGSNVLVWDGLDSEGNPVGQGVYTATITASTVGYNAWTKTSDDNNPGNQIFDPYGIAVNKNTNSFFYGRIFVGNATSVTWAGQNGIYKFNADCSDADEGVLDTSGYPWWGHMKSPWKLEVSHDDRVYVNDWNDFYGIVLAFDQTISTYTTIVNQANWPASTNGDFARLSGPFVTGTGTNTKIWMADVFTPSFGIVRYDVTADLNVASGDLGTCIVPAGEGSDLSEAPWDLSVGTDGMIYVIQNIIDSTDPAPRVLCFPPFAAEGPNTNAIWKAGAGADSSQTNAPFALGSPTNLENSYGISVDPSDRYVAVAVRGLDRENGGVVILDAATGNMVTNLDNGPLSSYMDVTWDRVGNVYGTQEELWRVFSPPGPNKSMTPALTVIQKLDVLRAPVLNVSSSADAQVQLTLQGQDNVTYVIESSTNLVDWTAITTNCAPTSVRSLNVTPTQDCSYYRALVAH